jgi:hypothetical protein
LRRVRESRRVRKSRQVRKSRRASVHRGRVLDVNTSTPTLHNSSHQIPLQESTPPPLAPYSHSTPTSRHCISPYQDQIVPPSHTRPESPPPHQPPSSQPETTLSPPLASKPGSTRRLVMRDWGKGMRQRASSSAKCVLLLMGSMYIYATERNSDFIPSFYLLLLHRRLVVL